MEGHLIGTSVGTPLIVSQDAATSKVTWANINSSINGGNKPVTTNVDEPMLDWKSLEFLGLVEEYVSAVIKGEKTTTSSVGPANTTTSSSTITTTPNAADTVVVSTDSFAADATAALPNLKYAAAPPEVIFSSVKPTTPSLDVAAQKATPSTLFVMKNVGPNGNVSTPAEMPPGSGALMGQLSAAGSMPTLGSAVAPLTSFGNVASFGDLATFLPVGTALPLGATLIASPINVDGTQSLQNVTFTVRDDMSLIQPTVLAQAPVQAISAASGHQNLEQFNIPNDFNYQVDYVVNEDLSRDGLSPNDSFESSSLSLSVGDPSPSSDDCAAENLNDVIILSQTQQPQNAAASAYASSTTTGMPQDAVAAAAATSSIIPAIQQVATSSPSAASLAMANTSLLSSLNDPTLFSRVVQPALSLQQAQQRQQQQQQPTLQSKLSMPSTSSVTTAVGPSPIGIKSQFLNQASLANALKVHNMSVATQQQQRSLEGLPTQALPTQGGIATQNGVSAQSLSTQSLSTQGISSMGAQMGMPSTSDSMNPKGGLTKVNPRRKQAKHVPEESLPFPCEVCGRRFVSMHSVKRHMAIHDLDRPWKCEVCHKCFKQQAHLYSHKFTHTGSKPFECTMCHKSFNVKSNLHRHEKEVCKVPLESRTPTRSK